MSRDTIRMGKSNRKNQLQLFLASRSFLLWCLLIRGQCFSALSFSHSDFASKSWVLHSGKREFGRMLYNGDSSDSDTSTTFQNTFTPNLSSNKSFQAYQKEGILYQTSILTPREFQIIRNDVFLKESKTKMLALTLKEESSLSIATNRMGATLSSNSNAVKAIENPNGSIYKFVNRMSSGNTDETCGEAKKMVLATHIPVEVRVYEKKGSGMDWHKDDVLYDPPQVEVVLTVENTSDCITLWDAPSDVGTERKGVETAPNSAIFLRAGGPPHAVSSLKYGRRVIVKFAYVQEGAVLLEDGKNDVYQFGKATGTVSQKRSKTKKRQCLKS